MTKIQFHEIPDGTKFTIECLPDVTLVKESGSRGVCQERPELSQDIQGSSYVVPLDWQRPNPADIETNVDESAITGGQRTIPWVGVSGV